MKNCTVSSYILNVLFIEMVLVEGGSHLIGLEARAFLANFAHSLSGESPSEICRSVSYKWYFLAIRSAIPKTSYISLAAAFILHQGAKK